MISRIIVKKYVNSSYSFVKLPISFKSNNKRLKYSWKSNNEKLYNNIIRAKTNILDYIMNNNFKYFVTITVNSNHDRKDLEWLQRNTSQIIRNMRLKYGCDSKYVLIPEQHKDGSWHMHGVFDETFENDFYINNNGFLSWSSYDKIGFSSISIIHDYLACAYYITKYVRKDFEKREKGRHLYFCSKNLIKSNKILDLVVVNDDLNWDYVGDFASKLNVNVNDFVDVLCNLKKDVYSVLEDKECLL